MYSLDAGYYYGIGAFETILIKKGKPILIDEHMKRLNSSLLYLHIDKKFTRENVLDFLRIKNQMDGILKITVSEQNIDFSTRENPYTPEVYKTGFQLTICSFLRNETSPLTYHKTLNYAENILARQEARKRNYDEALFLNTKGELCEGSCSNIFFVKGQQLYTPKVSSGLLPGIIRNYICENENAIERSITLDDIKYFDECFITNSILGIMKISNIEGHYYHSSAFTDTIRNKYKEIQCFN
ncbi:MAG: hypothetical protein K0S47_1443 [Herbinix sp.]|jgi:4-amino-4-deoxychorismate lyase|nr:hypothetical protein [Herbinix sp.]